MKQTNIFILEIRLKSLQKSLWFSLYSVNFFSTDEDTRDFYGQCKLDQNAQNVQSDF